MQPAKPVIWIFLLCFIYGCNLAPLYGNKTNGKTAYYLSQIEIHPIESIEGVEFYNRMSSILPTQTGNKYLLKVELTYSSKHGIIQKNSDIIMENLEVTSKYSLLNKNTGKLLTSGSFRRVSSHSTIFMPYNNTVKTQDSTKNLATAVAEEIRTRLILFFENSISDEALL